MGVEALKPVNCPFLPTEMPTDKWIRFEPANKLKISWTEIGTVQAKNQIFQPPQPVIHHDMIQWPWVFNVDPPIVAQQFPSAFD